MNKLGSAYPIKLQSRKKKTEVKIPVVNLNVTFNRVTSAYKGHIFGMEMDLIFINGFPRGVHISLFICTNGTLLSQT